MADFLRRLADRALGLTPIVEARPGLDASRWWGGADSERDAPVEAPGALPQSGHVHPPSHVLSRRDVRGRRQVPNVPSPVDDVLDSGSLPARKDNEEAPPVGRAHGPSAHPTPSRARRREPKSPDAQRPRAFQTPHGESPTADPPQPPPASATDVGEVTRDERAATVVPSRTLVVPSPRDTPVTPAAARRTATSSISHPTPPAVHVTIGRLEVRALTTAPPATPRAAAPAPQPRLTLAEYLARREQGR